MSDSKLYFLINWLTEYGKEKITVLGTDAENDVKHLLHIMNDLEFFYDIEQIDVTEKVNELTEMLNNF